MSKAPAPSPLSLYHTCVSLEDDNLEKELMHLHAPYAQRQVNAVVHLLVLRHRKGLTDLRRRFTLLQAKFPFLDNVFLEQSTLHLL